MATIRDIARVSGYGVGTVSRVLNGGTNVRRETSETILDAARRLQYVPAGRRSARSWSNTTLGIALPSVIHPFYLEIVKGVYSALEETRYHLLLYNLGRDPSAVFRHILEEAPAGLMVVGDEVPPPLAARMQQEKLPLLYLDRQAAEAPSFWNDNRQGGRLAAGYLLGRGCRRPAYIGEQYQSQQQQERLEGFRERLREDGIRQVREYRLRPEAQEARELTATLLRNRESDGLFYFSDTLAYGGAEVLRTAAEPLPFIGYDDQLPSRWLGVSSIRQPGLQLGKEGVQALLDHITKGRPLVSRAFAPELLERSFPWKP